MLVQTVDEPTRNDNTLEIFLAKNERAIRNIEVQETKLSDHDLVSVDLQYNCISNITSATLPKSEVNSFRSFNLHKADFEKDNAILTGIIFLSSAMMILMATTCWATVLQVCTACSPKKLPGTVPPEAKSGHARKRYILNKKRRKLNTQLHALNLKARNPSSIKITKIEDEISLIHFEIKESHNVEYFQQEN